MRKTNLTTVDALAAQWAKAIDAALQRARERRSSAWSRFAAEVQASAEPAFSKPLASVTTIIPSLFAAALVIGLFWGTTAWVRWLMRIIFHRFVEDKTMTFSRHRPDANVFTSRIINNTADPVRRGSVELFLGYDQDLKRAVAAMRDAAQAAAGVLDEPAASVRVRDLGQDGIVVEVRFWCDSRRSEFVSTASNVRAELVVALTAAEIGLPDPDVRVLEPGVIEKWQEAMGGAGDGSQSR